MCKTITREKCKVYATTLSRSRGMCQRECEQAGYPFPKNWAVKTEQRLRDLSIRLNKKSKDKSRTISSKHKKSRSMSSKRKKSRLRK